MDFENTSILVLNGGSSSIRFSFYNSENTTIRKLNGKIERIGLTNTRLIVQHTATSEELTQTIKKSDYKSVVKFLINFLEETEEFKKIAAIGHRIVHGMNHAAPEIITKELLEELHRMSPYDSEHLIGELALIEAFKERHSSLPQIACFDTAFHQTMPEVARLLPIPRHFYKKGIRRYGFHGLSYNYLLEELTKLSEAEATQGKLIFAHLGNGASLAAIKQGKSIDTSMSFTPASGILMSSRSGDIDPGIILYLIKNEHLTLEEFSRMINHESGIMGISETSSDMHDLLTLEASDTRASDAINKFCYEVKKNIGAYAAILGGLDTLVFAGGIGENAPEVRKRICEGLEFLGITLDDGRNKKNEAIISTKKSLIKVRIIRTDEESMIAKMSSRLLKKNA